MGKKKDNWTLRVHLSRALWPKFAALHNARSLIIRREFCIISYRNLRQCSIKWSSVNRVRLSLFLFPSSAQVPASIFYRNSYYHLISSRNNYSRCKQGPIILILIFIFIFLSGSRFNISSQFLLYLMYSRNNYSRCIQGPIIFIFIFSIRFPLQHFITILSVFDAFKKWLNVNKVRLSLFSFLSYQVSYSTVLNIFNVFMR